MDKEVVVISIGARDRLREMFKVAKDIAAMEPCPIAELRICLDVYAKRIESFTVMPSPGTVAKLQFEPWKHND